MYNIHKFQKSLYTGPYQIYYTCTGILHYKARYTIDKGSKIVTSYISLN